MGSGVAIDYTQPLDATVYVDPTVDTGYAAGTPLVTDAARIAMDSARTAFYQGDYNLALQHLNSALAQMPRDPAIHEFRALVLFALARYSEAATTLNAVLAVGPGWNWTTMSALYPDVAVYTAQLRALEAYSRQSPQAADGHFLLAYHYLTEGYPDASVKQLQQVVQLAPRDTVAAQLLQQLSPQSTAGTSETQPVTPPVTPPVTTLVTPPLVSGQSTSGSALTAAQLVGTWKASLPDGTSFTLMLDADSNFTWNFVQKGKSTAMSGTYTLGRSTLLLEDPEAGPMSGQVSLAPDGALSFRMAGAPAGQGEIVFRR